MSDYSYLYFIAGNEKTEIKAKVVKYMHGVTFKE